MDAKTDNQVLTQVEAFASKIIVEFSDKVEFHDIKFAHRFVKNIIKIGKSVPLSEKDQEVAILAAWLHSSGWGKTRILKFNEKSGEFDHTMQEVITGHAKKFFELVKYPEDGQKKVLEAMSRMDVTVGPETTIDFVLSDAAYADFTNGKAKKHMKAFYKEMLLRNADISKKAWYDVVLNLMTHIKFHTEYGKEKLDPGFQETVLQLQKDRKSLGKEEDLLLRRELDISDEELKKLKKSLKTVKGRDDRGIQTMFRTTSRNHYTLNQMVDRKASIMITINSIILSLVIGGVIGKTELRQNFAEVLPIAILTITNITSIVFAILAITPTQTHGTFTEEEIRNKKGNLLYFGNFHGMHPRDFEWGMLQLLNDGNYLYESMIRDLYYLGNTIRRKHKLIRFSLIIFISGLVAATIAFASCQCFLPMQ